MQWCSWVLYLNIFLTAINYCAKYGLNWYNIFLSCVSSSKVHNLLSLEVHKVAIRIISFRQKGKWNRREVLPCWRGGIWKKIFSYIYQIWLYNLFGCPTFSSSPFSLHHNLFPLCFSHFLSFCRCFLFTCTYIFGITYFVEVAAVLCAKRTM